MSITRRVKYFIVTGKNVNDITIVRTCADSNCDKLHYFTKIDDQFVANTIVRALNNG